MNEPVDPLTQCLPPASGDSPAPPTTGRPAGSLATDSAPASPGGFSARQVVMFAVISLALLMSSLDQTIVATGLHSLQHGLGASITWAGWTITAYSLGLVVMLPLSGKLSDRYGRRRVFLASAFVFSVASLFCGLADDIYLLVGLRVLQAIGGAGFTPSATGIVVENFGSARDRAVGLFGSIFPIGAMIGPVVGGLLISSWSWRGIFLVNVPIGALLIVLGLRFIPADRPRSDRSTARLDLHGLALLAAGILAAMFAITYLGDPGASPWALRFAGPVVLAVVALGAFSGHIRRVRDPFIAPRLIYGRGFGAVNVINIVYGGAVAGLVALVPLYATTRYGFGVLDSGSLLAAEGVAVIVMSSLAAMALRRTGYRFPLYTGSGLVVLGVLALAVPPLGVPAYPWLAGAGCLIGIGLGWSNPASRNACLQLAPERSAALAALRSTGRQIGSISSISLATAVLAQAADPGQVQAWVYAVAAALLLAAVPVISRVPEHFGSW